MKSFFKIKSVGGGMAHLLDDFCRLNHIHSPVNQQYKLNERIPFGLWLKKLRRIHRQYKFDGLGLDIGSMVQFHHIGIVAYIANSCGQLSEYLDIIPKYEKLWFNYMPKNYQVDQNHFMIYWEKPAYLQSGLYIQETAISEEIQVAIFYQQLSKLINTEKNIFHSLELTIPKPQNVNKYENYFKCPIKFNTDKTKITISKSLLNLKIKQADPFLLEILCDQANYLIKDMPQEDSFIELVYIHIIKAIENNHAQIDYIAKSLNTSPRMLQKDLKKRGISFQMILNNTRINLAKKHLKNESLSITEIAFLLAYKDQTSFNRAFKNWTGVAPSIWRKKNLYNI